MTLDYLEREFAATFRAVGRRANAMLTSDVDANCACCGRRSWLQTPPSLNWTRR